MPVKKLGKRPWGHRNIESKYNARMTAIVDRYGRPAILSIRHYGMKAVRIFEIYDDPKVAARIMNGQDREKADAFVMEVLRRDRKY